MKSQSDTAILPYTRRNSIEIISEEEIKSDTEMDSFDSGLPRKQKKRKIIRNAMSGFVLRYDIKEDDDMVNWQRFHVVTSDGIIVFSEASTLMIESRISLDNAIVREIRTRGQGALFIQTKDGQKMLLRFRNRPDRALWLRSLRFQATIQSLNGQVTFTPNKRRQIYFIDGTDEFQMQVENVSTNLLVQFQKAEKSEPKNKSKKRKGSVLTNIKSKIQKVSDFATSSLVSCFGNLNTAE